jgi:tripartite-type tricarboxylate transporter receptor subunit TctC
MHHQTCFAAAFAAIGVLFSIPCTLAQDRFPNRNVEFIVPWGPGGGADVLARLSGKALEARFQTPVLAINMPGALGAIGLGKLISSPADGHTLAVLTADSLTAVAAGSAPWRLDQVTALAVMIRQPSGIFVRTESRFKSLAEVIKEAAANPGKITVGTTGPGSADDMTLNHLASRGVPLLGIPYPKPAERYTALLGGHVDLLYEQAGDVKGHLDGKRMRPLLFFHPSRIAPEFDNIPVSTEFGYEILLPQFRAILVRSGTDPKRVQRLVEALESFSKSPEFAAYLKEQLAAADSFIPSKSAQDFLRGELDTMRKILATTPPPAKP